MQVSNAFACPRPRYDRFYISSSEIILVIHGESVVRGLAHWLLTQSLWNIRLAKFLEGALTAPFSVLNAMALVDKKKNLNRKNDPFMDRTVAFTEGVPSFQL
jgi:hypothetical protein